MTHYLLYYLYGSLVRSLFTNRQQGLVGYEIMSVGRSMLLVSACLHGYTGRVTSQARPSGCRIQSDVDEWSRPLMDDGVTLSGCPDEHRAPVFDGGQIPGSHRIVVCCCNGDLIKHTFPNGIQYCLHPCLGKVLLENKVDVFPLHQETLTRLYNILLYRRAGDIVQRVNGVAI